MSRQLPCPWEESFQSKDLVDGAVVLCFCGTELLTAQQKVSTTNLSDHFRPYDVQAISRHDAECRMRCILKERLLGGQDDVAEQRVLGMHGHRSVDGRDHGRLDIEYVLEKLCALA